MRRFPLRRALLLAGATGLALMLGVAAEARTTAPRASHDIHAGVKHKRRHKRRHKRKLVRTLPGSCLEYYPCHFARGRYKLGRDTVLPGFRLTLPRHWSSGENNAGELNLIPPGRPDDRLFVWRDMVAVKSTGTGHGTALLTVGQSPSALVSWLTSNPDFLVASPPSQSTVVGIPATTLTIGVSTSANYGDPGCPTNPRCADLLTNTLHWGDNSYGIGGDELARFSIASIKLFGSSHNFFVTLDATNSTDMQGLAAQAAPIIASFRLPKGVTAG